MAVEPCKWLFKNILPVIVAGLFFTAISSSLMAVPSSPAIVKASNYRILVQNRLPNNSLAVQKIYAMQGAGWNPYSIGNLGPPAQDADWAAWYATDIPLMAEMHCNTLRTWKSLPQDATGTAILDMCYNNGIMVVMSVDDTGYAAAVNAFKNHPAILMWLVGNEWNANLFYGKYGSLSACITAVNNACAGIKALDPNHPVATCYGDLPDSATYSSCTGPDVWGINIYIGASFGSLFSTWKSLTPSKPLFWSEYGNDAYNDNTSSVDELNQAITLKQQWKEITNNMVSVDPANNVCTGGCIFEFSDEWWKHGNPSSHEAGGFTGKLDVPDGVMDEEWWGLVDINRNRRLAFYAMKSNWLAFSITQPRISFSPNPPVGKTNLTIRVTYQLDMTAYTLRSVTPSHHTNFLPLTPVGAGTTHLTNSLRISDTNVSGSYILIFTALSGTNHLSAISSFLVDTSGPDQPVIQDIVDRNGTLLVEWAAVADNLSGVKSYNIFRSTDCVTFALMGSSSSLFWVDKSVSANVLYYYKISALDDTGNEGPRSAALSGKITAGDVTVYPVPVDFKLGPLKCGINLSRDSVVLAEVLNQTGYKVRTILKNSLVQKGWYVVEWEGKDEQNKKIPHGVYFLKFVVSGGSTTIKKIIVVD